MPLIHSHTNSNWLPCKVPTSSSGAIGGWGHFGGLLRDTSTHPGWDRTGNPPTARQLLLPPEPYRPLHIDVSVTPIHNSLHKYNYRGSIARCKPLVAHKSRIAKKYLKEPADKWPTLTCIRVMARAKCGGRKELLKLQSTPPPPPSSMKHGDGGVIIWACVAAIGTSKRMNSEVYRSSSSAKCLHSLYGASCYCFMIPNTAKGRIHFSKPKMGKLITKSNWPDLKTVEHAFHMPRRKRNFPWNMGYA